MLLEKGLLVGVNGLAGTFGVIWGLFGVDVGRMVLDVDIRLVFWIVWSLKFLSLFKNKDYLFNYWVDIDNNFIFWLNKINEKIG